MSGIHWIAWMAPYADRDPKQHHVAMGHDKRKRLDVGKHLPILSPRRSHTGTQTHTHRCPARSSIRLHFEPERCAFSYRFGFESWCYWVFGFAQNRPRVEVFTSEIDQKGRTGQKFSSRYHTRQPSRRRSQPQPHTFQIEPNRTRSNGQIHQDEENGCGFIVWLEHRRKWRGGWKTSQMLYRRRVGLQMSKHFDNFKFIIKRTLISSVWADTLLFSIRRQNLLKSLHTRTQLIRFRL